MTMQETSLKALFEQHPLALQALERSLERQQEARQKDVKAKTRDPEEVRCPYCASAAKVVTIGQGANAKAMHFRPGDCCELALRDTAVSALKYSLNPLGDKAERLEQGIEYARLRQQISSPSILAELDALALALKDVTGRVIDSGRCFEQPKPAIQKARMNVRLN